MTAGERPGAGGAFSAGARRTISSGGPWEASAGYSRAVVVGDSCFVSGTTDAGPDGQAVHPESPGEQARAAFATISAALAEAGLALEDVVRTRMFVTDMAHSGEVLAVHGALFGSIRPAATIVEVRRLIDESLLVEIEVDAKRP